MFDLINWLWQSHALCYESDMNQKNGSFQILSSRGFAMVALCLAWLSAHSKTPAILQDLNSLPATEELITSSDIQKDWKQTRSMSPVADDPRSLLEVSALTELNLKTLETYEALANKAHGLSEFQDSFANLFEDESRTDRRMNIELVKILHSAVYSFLASTQVPGVGKANETSYSIRLHPLLTQMIVGIISSMKIFPLLEAGPGIGWRLLRVLNEREAERSYSADRQTRINATFLKNFQSLKNATRILSLISPESCLSWGLWPQATLGLLRGLEANSYEGGLWSDRTGSLDSRNPDSKIAFAFHVRELTKKAMDNHRIACAALGPIETTERKDEIRIRNHPWIAGQSNAWWIETIKAFRMIDKSYN